VVDRTISNAQLTIISLSVRGRGLENPMNPIYLGVTC